jgi:hypothetical protein
METTPDVRLKSPLPGETASLRLPDYMVCLCRGCREYVFVIVPHIITN